MHAGFISGLHVWLIRVLALKKPDSVFIGACRSTLSVESDPQDLPDRTYYLSNGVIRISGSRVEGDAGAFGAGDVVACLLDADRGHLSFYRNGVVMGSRHGLRGRIFPCVWCDDAGDKVRPGLPCNPML
jgi:hypothetical protein